MSKSLATKACPSCGRLFKSLGYANHRAHCKGAAPKNPEPAPSGTWPFPISRKSEMTTPIEREALSEERIMDIVRPFCEDFRWPSSAIDSARAILAASSHDRARIRAEALEEAAKEAESDRFRGSGSSPVQNDIARAIRALAQPPGEKN